MSNTDIPAWIEANLFENVLRETVEDFQQIIEFKVLPALAPGENYATVVLRVHIEVLLTTGRVQNQRFILKVAHDTDLYRNELSKWELFVSESGMYRDIKPEFEELYAQNGLDVKFGAKSYRLPVEEEHILLEDLSLRGFKNAKRQEGLDMEHCKAVLKKIAQFHAASAVRKEQKGVFEKPYLYGFLIEESKNFTKSIFDTTIPRILKGIEKLENNGDYFKQISRLAANATDMVFQQLTVDENEFNVLNHGDCWANNIMFQYDSKGELKDTYLVDYQMPRYGSPAQDLLYFIISSAHLDIKVQQFDYMIKYYHDQLSEHLKLLQYPRPLPSLREIHAALIKYGIWGFITAVGIMAAVLCQPTETANMDNFVGNTEDGDKFKDMLYTNDQYIEHLKVILPWLCYRGALES